MTHGLYRGILKAFLFRLLVGLNNMAYAAGAKILKDAGEQATDCEKQLSAALVEVENNAAADLKAVLKELYFKVRIRKCHGTLIYN